MQGEARRTAGDREFFSLSNYGNIFLHMSGYDDDYYDGVKDISSIIVLSMRGCVHMILKVFTFTFFE